MLVQADCLSVVTPQWLAVQVRGGREMMSAAHLRLRGYEVFLPCYRERRRWSDRIKEADRALFIGYIFCRVGGDVSGRIVTAPGVIRIVGDGRGPIPIPDDEIRAIQRIVDTHLSVAPWRVPATGQSIRIETGPLSGIEGVVISAKNQHRLVVSISLLQRAVAVEIDSEWIGEPALKFAAIVSVGSE